MVSVDLSDDIMTVAEKVKQWTIYELDHTDKSNAVYNFGVVDGMTRVLTYMLDFDTYSDNDILAAFARFNERLHPNDVRGRT